MFALRRLILARRHLAALICVAVLALKLLVPSGYMISNEHGRVAITICSGTVPPIAGFGMIGMHGAGADHGPSKKHGKAEMPCAFASLSAQALAAGDLVLLGAAAVFVMGIEPLPTRSLARAIIPHLRPPLRGPPAFL